MKKFTQQLMTVVLIAVPAIWMSGCSQPQDTGSGADQANPVPAATKQPASEDAGVLVDQARALYEESVALGFSWTATASQLATAQAALASGDREAASSAAAEAIALAEASIAQAATEAHAWLDRAPFN